MRKDDRLLRLGILTFRRGRRASPPQHAHPRLSRVRHVALGIAAAALVAAVGACLGVLAVAWALGCHTHAGGVWRVLVVSIPCAR